ncbi:MAG: TonB-dependent receptor [Crocinitomicaceae bacterium]|nr:TonB-dependent receptor [Crocinitomicaceae bacterium]
MKQLLITIVFITNSLLVFTQVRGYVYGNDTIQKKAIKGASLMLLEEKLKTTTNEDGAFEFILPKTLPQTLVISAKGYYNDTVILSKKDRFSAYQIVLYSEKLLPEIVVAFRKTDHGISRLKTLHVEEINSGELRKAACCNLSESFESNASVDVNITDAVSGAKKIQLLGLDGVYTQIQLENVPILRGLESSFGITSIPGTWISSIQITKGTGTVVNGYESMAGLINLELKKPEQAEHFFLNGYQSAFGRSELNVNHSIIVSPKWRTTWFLHGSTMLGKMDNNHDNYYDIPLSKTIAAMNRWQYQGKKMEAQIGFNTYFDEKLGGEINAVSPYRVTTKTKHVDIFAKTGFFLKKPTNSIGVVYAVKSHTITSKFGNRDFLGTEKRGYINALFDGIIGTTIHKIKVGISANFIQLHQKSNMLVDNRVEIVPGSFLEYTFSGIRLTTVLGARLDIHSQFGAQFVPRFHAKYTLNEYMDLRLTAGKGWRVPNFMIDNISLMANSKIWVKATELKPEKSWNIGTSLVNNFKLLHRKTSVTIDYYFTYFENQLIVDRDANTAFIYFKNEQNTSYSSSLQMELDIELAPRFSVRFAYKNLLIRAQYNGIEQQQVMVPRDRFLTALSYSTRNKRWEFASNISIYGAMRLPNYQLNSLIVENEKSQAYPLINLQITHLFKKWDFYVGIENLSNFKQKNAIIDPSNPFGNDFDATRIWGPIMGINIYGGIRFTLKN